MIATATARQYQEAISTLAAWDGIDALVVIFVRPLLIKAEDVAEAVARAVQELPREIPVQAVFMSTHDRAAMIRKGGVPTYLYPEHAAHALARVVDHAERRRRPAEAPPGFDDVRPEIAAAAIAEGLGEGAGWLDFERFSRLLNAYGIPLAERRMADHSQAAADAAAEIGGRVALKALGPDIVHKTDLGAPRVGLSGREQVANAAAGIDEGLRRAGVSRERLLSRLWSRAASRCWSESSAMPSSDRLSLRRWRRPGRTAERHGGAAQPPDITRRGQTLRSSDLPLLTGYRGAPEMDLEALQELLLRTSAMVEAHHEIAELDLNPVIVAADGTAVVDARVRVETAAPRRSWPSAGSSARRRRIGFSQDPERSDEPREGMPTAVVADAGDPGVRRRGLRCDQRSPEQLDPWVGPRFAWTSCRRSVSASSA